MITTFKITNGEIRVPRYSHGRRDPIVNSDYNRILDQQLIGAVSVPRPLDDIPESREGNNPVLINMPNTRDNFYINVFQGAKVEVHNIKTVEPNAEVQRMVEPYTELQFRIAGLFKSDIKIEEITQELDFALREKILGGYATALPPTKYSYVRLSVKSNNEGKEGDEQFDVAHIEFGIMESVKMAELQKLLND